MDAALRLVQAHPLLSGGYELGLKPRAREAPEDEWPTAPRTAKRTRARHSPPTGRRMLGGGHGRKPAYRPATGKPRFGGVSYVTFR
jgi:hypothetical protein